MEFPRRAVTVERLLAAAAVAAALGVARLEAGSALAPRARQGRPWLAWLAARDGAAAEPSLHLLVYDPILRRLVVLHAPGDMRIDGRRTLERAYQDALKATKSPASAETSAEDLAEVRLRALSPQPIPEVSERLTARVPPLAAEDEPAVAAARELRLRSRRPGAWLALAREAWRGVLAGDRTAVDPLLFELEMRRVKRGDLRPARLPGEAAAPELLGRLLAPDPPPTPGRAVTAEVLNGTTVPGLASRTAKMLRFKGVDVLSTATERARERTLVYDRVGDFPRAAGTLAALDCPTARAVTRVDETRAVDVSVLLGADCADLFGPGDGREP